MKKTICVRQVRTRAVEAPLEYTLKTSTGVIATPAGRRSGSRAAPSAASPAIAALKPTTALVAVVRRCSVWAAVAAVSVGAAGIRTGAPRAPAIRR